MKKKTKRTLVTLQVLMVIMMLCMLACAVYMGRLANDYSETKEIDFDSKLSHNIGDTYTPNLHTRIVGSLNMLDSAGASAGKAMQSFSEGALALTGAAIFVSISSLFIVARQSSEE